MKKRAIISVFDKTGVVDFAQKLVEDFNYEIVSTGGTYDVLTKAGIPVTEVASITNFPELLNGRVKTLHPSIHAGILASRSDISHMEELEKYNISSFDIVVVNLYPFEKAVEEDLSEVSELIEYIDIGGVTLLRAAAKNYFFVTPVFKPEQYSSIIEDLEQNKGITSYDKRKDLAIEAFSYVSSYDAVITNELSNRIKPEFENKLPKQFGLNMQKKQDLRYGENPHQQAALYTDNTDIPFELIQGKELSFNNFVDLTSAMNIISEFIDVPAACIIKHNNPCGVALGENIFDAYTKAFNCDPISAFGGIIGVNQPVDENIAKLAKDVFLEVIVAPDFTEEALEILSAKKNLRLVKVSTSALEYKARNAKNIDIKKSPFGTLVQTTDTAELTKDTFKVVTSQKPTEEQVEDMIFAWKVAKHVKSNAIVIAKDKTTLGIGVGQTSRIASMEIALNNVCDSTKDAVIASDGFFPAIDNIHAAAQARIAAIIQPGGSIKDKDVIVECDKYEIAMITTSVRHFKH